MCVCVLCGLHESIESEANKPHNGDNHGITYFIGTNADITSRERTIQSAQHIYQLTIDSALNTVIGNIIKLLR